MVSFVRKLALAAACCFLFSGILSAQVTQVEGVVTGDDGQPLKGAKIRIDRLDIKGTYWTKTDKKGRYIHAGLPIGVYNVTCMVDGKERDFVKNVRTSLSDAREINFNLQELKRREQALNKAAETGNLTDEQKREMSPEQKAAVEKSMKEREAQLAKNKELNDAFNTGKDALEAKQWDAAIQAFQKAGELDPKQHVVWASLADAYAGLANTKTGTDRDAALNKCAEAYQKAIEAAPTDSGYYNNYGLVLAKQRKFAEAQAQLEKAAAIDPQNAGKYFYNLGAVLVNTGQLEPAGKAFKRAIDADPNYADAQYQYGVYLISKATTTPDGKIIPPPGTVEAFQKYLELKPNGPYADAAKGMLATIQSTIQTTYKNPNAPQKKKK